MENLNGRTERNKSLIRDKSSYTAYLSATAIGFRKFFIEIQGSPIARPNADFSKDIRYSPILPAFLNLKNSPPYLPKSIRSVSLLFARSPYKALGLIRGQLTSKERSCVYFSEGLASIVLIDFSFDKARTLRSFCNNCPLEFWSIKDGIVDDREVQFELGKKKESNGKSLVLPSTRCPELTVYVEQIAASLASLWASYSIYIPGEKSTLKQLAVHTSNLVKLHNRVKGKTGRKNILFAIKKNAMQ